MLLRQPPSSSKTASSSIDCAAALVVIRIVLQVPVSVLVVVPVVGWLLSIVKDKLKTKEKGWWKVSRKDRQDLLTKNSKDEERIPLLVYRVSSTDRRSPHRRATIGNRRFSEAVWTAAVVASAIRAAAFFIATGVLRLLIQSDQRSLTVRCYLDKSYFAWINAAVIFAIRTADFLETVEAFGFCIAAIGNRLCRHRRRRRHHR